MTLFKPYPITLTACPLAMELPVPHDPAYLAFLASRSLAPPDPTKPAGKPYIAEIRGYHAIYGLDRRFIPSRQIGELQWTWSCPPGVYEIQKHADSAPKRGFVSLNPADGKMTHWSVETLLKWLDSLPPREPEPDRHPNQPF